MFEEDDDDDDDDFIESDFEKWFHDHETDLPRELVDDSERYTLDLSILYDTYSKTISPLIHAINLLLPKHYSLFDDEMRPPIVEKIEAIAPDIASLFLFELFKLVYDQKSGVNVREKYNPFDFYVKHYGRPAQPQFMREEYRGALPDLSDEEWAERVREVNIEIQEEFDEENTPRVEFFDALQSVVFSHYSELENLNPDEWIIYALILHNVYREYQDRCWLVESFIDYGLPLHYLELSSYDLAEKIMYIKDELWEIEYCQRKEERQKEG